MNNSLNELFLIEYFKQVAALGPFCGKKAFDFLAKVFLLPSETGDALWQAVEQETVADVVTLEDANRYKRILQLGSINGIPLNVSEQNIRMVSIKSSAIAEMSAIDMCAERNVTVSQVLQNLHSHASQCYVSAMYIWGTMQCDGNAALSVDKRFEKGVSDIEKAAHWGYIPAILTILYYLSNGDKYPVNQIGHSSEYYQKLLYTFAVNSPYCDLLSALNLKQSEQSQSAQLLLGLIAQRKIKAEIFDKSIAKVVYGDTIDIVAKEKLLSDADVKIISEMAILPMHLLRGTYEIGAGFFSSLPFINRDVEQKVLRGELNHLGDSFFEQRKPLCLCCEDKFVLDAYRQGFEKMEIDNPKPQHVVTIDVGELSDEDLQQNADNIFVANCKNNAHNVYLFVLQGNVSSDKINAVKFFLKSNKRAKFKLNKPSVTLDLSPIVPLCFCDKQNANKLSGFVNTQMVATLSVEERKRILKQRIQDVNRRFKEVSRRVVDSDIDLLSRHPLDIALMALDKLYSEWSDNDEKDLKGIAFYIAEVEKYHNGNRGYGFGG